MKRWLHLLSTPTVSCWGATTTSASQLVSILLPANSVAGAVERVGDGDSARTWTQYSSQAKILPALAGKREEEPLGRKTLTVLESPWEDSKGEIAEHSMRPFIEGLCAFYGWRLIYRTFTTAGELANLVDGEAFDDADRKILYISSHGLGGRLQAGVKRQQDINLASVADKLRSGIEGVWIGACDVGTSKSFERFLGNGGALWAGGYTCSVDWDSCMLIDLAVLNEIMRLQSPRSRDGVVRIFHDGFCRFDPGFEMGDDADGVDVELCDAVRLWAREPGRGRPEDVTEQLLEDLGWLDEDEE